MERCPIFVRGVLHFHPIRRVRVKTKVLRKVPPLSINNRSTAYVHSLWILAGIGGHKQPPPSNYLARRQIWVVPFFLH
jgi:hypothetical protein